MKQEATAATLAEDARVRLAGQQLIDLAKKEGTNDAVLVFSPQLAGLRDYLKPALKIHRYEGFMLVNRKRRVLGAFDDQYVGKFGPVRSRGIFEQGLRGATDRLTPFCKPAVVAGRTGCSQDGPSDDVRGGPGSR